MAVFSALSLKPIDLKTVSNEIEEPKWLTEKDLDFSDPVKKVIGNNVERVCVRLNAAPQAAFQKVKEEVGDIFGRFTKLQEMETLFLGIQNCLEKLTDQTLWDKYTVDLSEEAARYVDVYAAGGPCQECTLFVHKVAEKKVGVSTQPFPAKGFGGALELKGMLIANGKTWEMAKEKNILDACEGLRFVLDDATLACVEVRPAESAEEGLYQFCLSEEQIYQLEEKSSGKLLDALGIVAPIYEEPVSAVDDEPTYDYATISDLDIAEGERSIFSINGIKLTRKGARIENILPNVTLTLKKAMTEDEEPLKFSVTFEKKVIKAFLTELANLLGQYERKLEEYVPLGGQVGPLTRFYFLRTFWQDFQLLCTELRDEKTDSSFGLKKLAGFTVFDQEAFADLSKNFEAFKKYFVGDASEEAPLKGRLKTFSKGLGFARTSFAENLQTLARAIEKQKGRVEKVSKDLETQRKSYAAQSARLRDYAGIAEVQQQFTKNLFKMLREGEGNEKS